MKKLKFGLLLCACAMFTVTGCNKDSDGQQVTDIEDYFAVDGGQLIIDNLPKTSESNERPEIKSVQGNSNVVNGGASAIQLESDDQFSKIIVGLKGQEVGYYEITNFSKSASSSISFTLLISEELSESMILVFTIVDTEGLVGVYKELETQLVETLGGALQINCSWNLLNDIDLHVVTPNGNEIYYGNSGIDYDYIGMINHYLDLSLSVDTDISEIELTDEQWEIMDNLTVEDMRDFTTLLSGGSLDIDSNAACETDGINSENIIFVADDIQVGEYIVRVDFYEDCVGSGVTNFVVLAKLYGELINTDTDNPVSDSFNAGEDDYGDIGDGVEIMRFSITENQLKSSAMTKSSTYDDKISTETKPSFRAILNSKTKIIR